jgi:hypothetical protein
MQEPETTDKLIFDEEEINNISELVRVLMSIRTRLRKEGVDIDHWRKKFDITKGPTATEDQK